MIRFSLENLVAAATIVGSADDLIYPAVNLKAPERPFLPARTSTTTGAQNYVIDFGSPATLDIIAPIATNFADVTFEGNDADSWDSPPPSYSEDATIARNPWNARYQRAHRPAGTGTPFEYRYLRQVIPSQTPIGGASYYEQGGLWAGRFATTPLEIRFSYTMPRLLPRQDDQPAHGGWRQRAILVGRLTTIKAHLRVRIGTTPASQDVLQAWLDLATQLEDVGFFLVALEDADPAQTWVMRLLNEPEWVIDYPTADSDLVLEEVVGP